MRIVSVYQMKQRLSHSYQYTMTRFVFLHPHGYLVARRKGGVQSRKIEAYAVPFAPAFLHALHFQIFGVRCVRCFVFSVYSSYGCIAPGLVQIYAERLTASE